MEGGSLPYLYPLVDLNDDFTYPVAQYDHDDLSNAIGAGFLYEGDAIPTLRGMYAAQTRTGTPSRKFATRRPTTGAKSPASTPKMMPVTNSRGSLSCRATTRITRYRF